MQDKLGQIQSQTGAFFLFHLAAPVKTLKDLIEIPLRYPRSLVPDIHLYIHLQRPDFYFYSASGRRILHCIFQDIPHSLGSPFGIMHRKALGKRPCLQLYLLFSGLGIHPVYTLGNGLSQGSGAALKGQDSLFQPGSLYQIFHQPLHFFRLFLVPFQKHFLFFFCKLFLL